MDNTTLELGESPYMFTLTGINKTDEHFPYAYLNTSNDCFATYMTPQKEENITKVSTDDVNDTVTNIKIQFIPSYNCIMSSSTNAEIYRKNVIQDTIERIKELSAVQLDYITPYLLYMLARDLRVLPLSILQNPDILPTAEEILELMILKCVSFILKLPLDARCWTITNPSGEPFPLSEQVAATVISNSNKSNKDIKDVKDDNQGDNQDDNNNPLTISPYPTDELVYLGMIPFTIVKLYSTVNVVIVQFITILSEHLHDRLLGIKAFILHYSVMKEIPFDQLKQYSTRTTPHITKFPMLSFRMYHWLDFIQQYLVSQFALSSELIRECSPSLTYSLRTIQAFTSHIERSGLAIDDSIIDIMEKLYEKRRIALDEGGNGLVQRPGQVCLSHRSYYPTTMGMTRGNLTVSKIETWCEGGFTITVNDAIGNVGLSLWPGALLLAEYAITNADIFENKTVVEMGSGVGLSASIISYATSPKRFITSDYIYEVLRLLGTNLRLNGLQVQEWFLEDGVIEDGEIVKVSGEDGDGDGDVKEEEEERPIIKDIHINSDPHDMSNKLVSALSSSSSSILPSKVSPIDALRVQVHSNCAKSMNTVASPNDLELGEYMTSPIVKLRETTPTTPIEIHRFDWFEPNIPDVMSWGCDLALSADCVYAPELIKPHLKSIRTLLGYFPDYNSELDIQADQEHSEHSEQLEQLEQLEQSKNTTVVIDNVKKCNMKKKYCIMAFQRRSPETFEKLMKGFDKAGLEIEHINLDTVSKKYSEYYNREFMYLFKITVKPTLQNVGLQIVI